MLAVFARLAHKTANADARRAARRAYNVSIAHAIIAKHTHHQTQKVFQTVNALSRAPIKALNNQAGKLISQPKDIAAIIGTPQRMCPQR